MRLALTFTAVLALTACGQKTETAQGAPEAAGVEAAPASSDAYAALPAEMQERADCAGAYAAVARMDPTSREQDLSNPWVLAYSKMLSGMIDASATATGMDAGNAALARAAHWKTQPEPAQQARADACKAKFG